MPTWLIAPPIVAALMLVAWWAETKVTIIVTELKAIREGLDKLRADRFGKDRGDEEANHKQKPLAG